jgi:hypothetical protein
VQFFLFALCAGPDMEQVKKEAMHFLSGGAAQRAVVDGVKIYSEKELEQEMGEKCRYNEHTHTHMNERMKRRYNKFIHSCVCVCVCVHSCNPKP